MMPLNIPVGTLSSPVTLLFLCNILFFLLSCGVLGPCALGIVIVIELYGIFLSAVVSLNIPEGRVLQ